MPPLFSHSARVENCEKSFDEPDMPGDVLVPVDGLADGELPRSMPELLDGALPVEPVVPDVDEPLPLTPEPLVLPAAPLLPEPVVPELPAPAAPDAPPLLLPPPVPPPV